jgi:aromatic ring-opening dioxygenase catalytic subunit (LigB family)
MAMKLPTYFISHGGGPWAYMDGPAREAHRTLEAALQDMPRQLGRKPEAVLMISGHWEEREFTVMGSERPGMLYDYGGFPEHTYRVRYPAPGAPALARQVRSLAEGAGIDLHIDLQRGFDHGTFVPMHVIYPDADVPLLQLSLQQGFDAQAHIALGQALAPLREQGVLVIGSGLSYHNLRLFGPGAFEVSKPFDDWLGDTLGAAPAARASRLARWSEAPHARSAHPREEHLLPLMVALGAAFDETAARVHHDERFFGGAVVSSYRFGAAGA